MSAPASISAPTPSSPTAYEYKRSRRREDGPKYTTSESAAESERYSENLGCHECFCHLTEYSHNYNHINNLCHNNGVTMEYMEQLRLKMTLDLAKTDDIQQLTSDVSKEMWHTNEKVGALPASVDEAQKNIDSVGGHQLG